MATPTKLILLIIALLLSSFLVAAQPLDSPSSSHNSTSPDHNQKRPDERGHRNSNHTSTDSSDMPPTRLDENQGDDQDSYSFEDWLEDIDESQSDEDLEEPPSKNTKKNNKKSNLKQTGAEVESPPIFPELFGIAWKVGLVAIVIVVIRRYRQKIQEQRHSQVQQTARTEDGEIQMNDNSKNIYSELPRNNIDNSTAEHV